MPIFCSFTVLFLTKKLTFISDLIQRLRSRERERERMRSALQRRTRDTRRTLSYDAPPFYMPSDSSTSSSGGGTGGGSGSSGGGGGGSGGGTGGGSSSSNNDQPTSENDSSSNYRRQLGERLYPKVRDLQPVSLLNIPYIKTVTSLMQ